MNKIQLLYVKNIISRKHSTVQQQLSFFMRVENLSYDKQVDVVWAGEDGVWQTCNAQYCGMQGDDLEYWQALITFDLTELQAIPGNIQFGLRFRVFSEEYWDNNHGVNYSSEADSGILLAQNQQVQNVDFSNQFKDQQQSIPVTIAVANSFHAKKVTIHWTTDQWKTTHETACQSQLNYWDRLLQSNARNPNQYGVQIWSGCINTGEAFHLQYIICCEADDRIIWENNQGANYTFQREQLKILILNLHCYQEENQDEKFTLIAKVINELKIDIVCFQEVAEYWRDGQGDWESNSAKIINDRLHKPFHLHTDWSHLGFDKFREGVAILSRYPLSDYEARYVSDSHDIYNIHSRKVVMARAHVPYIGAVNVFSAHLSWMEDGFQQQFKRLHKWAEQRHTSDVKATFLCGDFNVTAGSPGYQFIVDLNAYEDQFLAANEQGLFEQIFRVNDVHWHDLLTDDYRIDYIFMNKSSELQVVSARTLFTAQDYGRVSDHCGYLMTFEPKKENNDKPLSAGE